MKNSTVLQVKKLYFSYGDVEILKNININLEKGKVLGIIGKSGCGKSTLLKIIAGFYKPKSGDVLILGVKHIKPTKNVIYLNQDYNQLFPWLTVEKNVAFSSNKKDKNNILKFLRYVELEDKINFYPCELSGGQKQRVVLARALIINPDILLMDEPFNSLDVTTRLNLQKTTKKMIEETNTTVLFVTHDIKEALFMSDHLLVFGKNKVTYYDKPQNLDKSFVSNLI